MSVGGGWRAALLAAVLLVPLAAEDQLRPQCPSAVPELCSFTEEGNKGEFYYKVSGHDVIIKFTDGGDFELNCDKKKVALQNSALPRFPSPVRVMKVTLQECAPPQTGSYADALAALNVTAFSELFIHSSVGDLTRDHFVGLSRLESLDVYELKDGVLASGALGDFTALRTLRLNKVRTASLKLNRLPRTLETLKLWYTGMERVHISTLPQLHSLDLSENNLVDVNASAARAMEKLLIDSRKLKVPEGALPPSLRTLQHRGWNDSHATPLTRCALLESFVVTGVNDNSTLSLPNAWVASCPSLTELSVSFVPLRDKLPAALLANASALNKFTCTGCSLSEVPPGLFDDTLQLQYVDLSDNKLKSLPSGLFLHTTSLKTLNLSHNNLTSAVAHSLAAVYSLQVLRLNNNKNLGDLCDSGNDIIGMSGNSSLGSLTNLTHLYLSRTGIQHVCSDWRVALLNLTLLDLTHIAFKHLTFSDLQYARAIPRARVYLGNGGEFNLLYTRADYKKVNNSSLSAISSPFQVTVKIFSKLRCTNETYWAALAFIRNKSHVCVNGLRCGNKGRSLVDVDTLTSDASEQCAPLHLPAHCTCGAREDKDHGAVVIVTCERANLTTLPRLPRAQHKWRLHLAYNNISTIHATDVVSDIVELDLRSSFVKRIDGEVAAKLANISLQLAGNELECGCEAFETLTALLSTTSRLRDAKDVRCVDGKSLTAARRVPCPSFVGPAVAALAVLMGAALAIIGLLARPKTRQHIKTVLIALGVLPPRPEPKEDCHRRFDAFVSYAHEDEDFVLEQLAERLESGSAPYRLCLHYRDWAPGVWIPAQIAASVRSSRRTLAVVSQNYVRSAWARAEFREAHGATLRDAVPRLVVVLLDDPDSLPLDPELNAYVRHNTYVRWGDPWFWEKLRQALPPPRKPPPEKSAAPPATDIAKSAVQSPSECDKDKTENNMKQYDKCTVV